MQVETTNNELPSIDGMEKPYTITESFIKQRISNVYISKELGPPEDYNELIDRLRTSPPQDIIYMYLNTPGGYVDTGVQLMNAMNDCPARIITVLDGTVCSMGALLFLAADEFIVHDNCRLMFHNYSGGTSGKGNEQISQLESTVNWYTDMFTKVCFPFLIEDEIEAVIAGQDIWLSSADVRYRLDTVVEYTKAMQKLDDMEKESEEAKHKKKRLIAELKRIDAAEKRELLKVEKAKEKSKAKNKTKK